MESKRFSLYESKHTFCLSDFIVFSKDTSFNADELYSIVRRWVRHLERDEQEVEDICQDVFVRVLAAKKTFRGDARISTWLYRITLNCHRDSIRKKISRREAREVDLKNENSLKRFQDDYMFRRISFANNFTADCVLAALSQISTRQCQLLEWKYNKGLSHAEIARLIGIRKESVWRSLSRARSAFKTAYHFEVHQHRLKPNLH